MNPSHAGLSEKSGKEEQPFPWLWEFTFLRLVNYVVMSVFPHSCCVFSRHFLLEKTFDHLCIQSYAQHLGKAQESLQDYSYFIG